MLNTFTPATATDAVRPLTVVSGPSPFTPGCNGVAQTGTNYPNAEVEPWVAINPTDPSNIIGAWQQDRWSNGGANGLVTGVSKNGGRTWTRTAPHFTRCSGGNRANGGNYQRASDPWVDFSPDGTAHQISLSFNDSNTLNAILVSRSTDGGDTWSEPITLIRDTASNLSNDKEAITADPLDSNFVYAVWDRLDTDANLGPTFFSRTTNGGQSWEEARIIYDPGVDAQTIGNQIAVLPNGDLVNVFSLFTNQSITAEANVAVIRSTDKGETWSDPIIINTLESIGVVDPRTQDPLRTGDIIPDIAVDQNTGALYVVWQDARFSGSQRDGIILSTSGDGGLTWSEPIQVNKVPRVQAFTAAVDVAADGTVGVTYYDFRRSNQSSPDVLLTNYWLGTSSDGGSTWKETRVAGPFDMRNAPIARGYFIGDYQGLAHNQSSFLPFFVRTNFNNTDDQTSIVETLKPVANGGPLETGNLAEDFNRRRLSRKELLRSHRR